MHAGPVWLGGRVKDGFEGGSEINSEIAGVNYAS